MNKQADHLDQVAITSVIITPVAFKDPPLLNTVGVHEPYALRAIVEVHTNSGISGVGETYGDAGHLARLDAAAAALTGTDVDYACDTHWPWKDAAEDVVTAGTFAFDSGAVKVPTGPGLGIELDRDALEHLHRQYLECGIRSRDDSAYMRRLHPSYELQSPRW